MYDTLGLWRAVWLSPRWQIRKEYLVLSKDLSTLETQRLPTDAQVPARWTMLTDADIPALRASNPLLSEAEMRRRWQEGQGCTGAWMGQQLAHYRWETDKRCYLPYLKKTFAPRAGDILISDAFTHRAFRRHGIHSQSTARSLIRARERGLSRSITMVAWWNVAARRVVLEKARRDVVGRVGYWEFGIATRHFATGNVRFDGAGDVYVAVA